MTNVVDFKNTKCHGPQICLNMNCIVHHVTRELSENLNSAMSIMMITWYVLSLAEMARMLSVSHTERSGTRLQHLCGQEWRTQVINVYIRNKRTCQPINIGPMRTCTLAHVKHQCADIIGPLSAPADKT